MSQVYEFISKVTLTSGQTSITFSNIPQTYNDLIIIASLRADTVPPGGTVAGLFVKINDTSTTTSVSGYTVRYLGAGGTEINSGIYSTGIYTGTFLRYIPGGSDSSVQNVYGAVEIYLPNYKKTSAISYSSSVYSEGNRLSAPMAVCSTGAPNGPVSSITLLSQSPQTAIDQFISNFSIGSSAYLYGI